MSLAHETNVTNVTNETRVRKCGGSGGPRMEREWSENGPKLYPMGPR